MGWQNGIVPLTGWKNFVGHNLDNISNWLEFCVELEEGVHGHGVEVDRVVELIAEAAEVVQRVDQVEGQAHLVKLPGEVGKFEPGKKSSKILFCVRIVILGPILHRNLRE